MAATVREPEPADPDPLEVGQRLLAQLAVNRERLLAIRRAVQRERLVLVAAELERDVAAGWRVYGRAARIARRLARVIPERSVYKLLAGLSERQKSAGTLPPITTSRSHHGDTE